MRNEKRNTHVSGKQNANHRPTKNAGWTKNQEYETCTIQTNEKNPTIPILYEFRIEADDSGFYPALYKRYANIPK